jgi:hypothetical protein
MEAFPNQDDETVSGEILSAGPSSILKMRTDSVANLLGLYSSNNGTGSGATLYRAFRQNPQIKGLSHA